MKTKGKKQRQPEKLSMEKMLAGFSPEVYEPELGTGFKVIVGTEAKIPAQIAWLKQELKKWVVLLNEKSGALVKSAEIEIDKFRHAKIVMQFFIRGEFIPSGEMHHKIKENLHGQIKKWLQELIIENFPPTFDYNNPMMKAEECIVFGYRKSRGDRYWSEDYVRLANSETLKQLLQVKANELDLDFISLDMKSDTARHALLKVRLRVDKDINGRFNIVEAFAGTLEAVGIKDLYFDDEEDLEKI